MCGMDVQGGLGTALRRGTLEFCVLALLETEQRYGVELVTRLGAESALTTTEGTLYPLLSRLRRAGWVDTIWQESPAGARDRGAWRPPGRARQRDDRAAARRADRDRRRGPRRPDAEATAGVAG